MHIMKSNTLVIMSFTKVPNQCSGSYLTGLTHSITARGAAVLHSVTQGAQNSEPSPVALSEPVGSSPDKKRRIKSVLLNSSTRWALARFATPGQVRQRGTAIKYQLNSIVVTVKLFTNSICIDTVKQHDSSPSRRTYPISASFRDTDLKSFYRELGGNMEWGNLNTNDRFKIGDIESRDYPITISLITLPYRLASFKLDAIEQMRSDLGQVVKPVSIKDAFKRPPVSLAEIQASITNGKTVYTVADAALSPITTRELRAILNCLSNPSRPSARVLNLIEHYLYLLKSALDSLTVAASKCK